MKTIEIPSQDPVTGLAKPVFDVRSDIQKRVSQVKSQADLEAAAIKEEVQQRSTKTGDDEVEAGNAKLAQSTNVVEEVVDSVSQGVYQMNMLRGSVFPHYAGVGLTPYQVATYGGALVLGMYVLKSYKEGGVDVDGSGQKRSVFRWIDAACGAMVAMLLINFARSVL